MPIDAMIRVSFQSHPAANQRCNEALTGVKQGNGTGPFEKVNTATYCCHGADNIRVLEALGGLNDVLADYSYSIDFVSITLTKRADQS